VKLSKQLIDDIAEEQKGGCCVWVRQAYLKEDGLFDFHGRELDLPED
jgi:hypothetical protein